MITFIIRRVLKFVPYYKYIGIVFKLLKITKALTMEKGILTKKDEKWLAKFLDGAIKLNGFAELIDGIIARILLVTVDNLIIDKYVPENWQNPIEELIKLGKERNKEAIAEWLDKKIDLPFLNELSERVAFESVVRFIAAKMYEYIDSVDIPEED